jgi:hypothetical protein
MIPSPSSSRFSLGLIAAVCLFSIPAVVGRAQGPRRTGAEERSLAIQRTAHALAKASATRGDLASAAKTLDDASSAPAGSAARSFETAQRLTLLAGDLSRAGNGAGAQAAASIALQYLADAARRTNDSDLKAAIQGQAGFLHERYLGDLASAKAAYRAAAQLAPKDASVLEKAAKLEAVDAESRRKAQENR